MPDKKENSQTSTNVLGDDLKPKTKEPDTSLNPNIENTKVLTENFGEFKGLNPYHLKKRLLDDSELFDKTAKKYFISSAGGPQNIEKQFSEDPQALNQQFEVFKKNFRKDLVSSSYSGETIDETLINRSIELADGPQKIKPDEYLSAIRENSKKYKKMGLIKDDGSFVYDGEDSSFGSYLANNKKLHRELQKDRYNQFEEELSKHHNKVAGLDDPTMKTKAWVVYDKKGPEGLTQFVNGLQEETVNDKFNENQYLAKSSVGDKTLSEYYKNFVVGNVENTKFGSSIAEIAYKYDVNPSLLSGLVEQESSFNPKAVSNKGAVGLTQLMPSSARQYGLKVPDKLVQLDKKRINSTGAERDKWERKLREATQQMEKDPQVDERYDPQKALQATGRYLSDSIKKFKSDELAIASYHRGVRGLQRDIETGNWREALPDSTKDYVRKVTQSQAKYDQKADQGLVFRPRKPRKGITEPIPKDLNRYTVQFYNKDGKSKELKTSIQDYVSNHLPQNVAEKFNPSNFRKDGPLSDEYRQVVSSVYKRAIEEDGYDMKDLMNTVYANATLGEMQGERFYQIDYGQLPWPAKQAFDAIRMNPETNSMVKTEGDGVYRIVPNMDSIALKANKKVRDMLYSTETQIVRKDGEVSFKEVPDKGFFSQIWNSGVNLMMGGSNFAMKYAGKPIFQGLNDLTGGDVDWIRNAKEAVEAQAGINLSQLSTADKDGWMPNAVEEVAPMFWYMASMWGMGGAIKKGIGKSMQLISRLKAGGDAMRLGALMDGASKFSRVGKALQQSSNPAMNFYAGGAALEALTPKKDSFYNVVPQMFGYGQDNPVSKFYNTADFWTRKAMDVGGSLMLDLGIDTFIGASKFAKDHVAKQFFDKNEFRSYEYVPEVGTSAKGDAVLSGKYKMKDTPTFQHEIRTFYNEIANGLAEKPIGNVGQSMAKNLSKSENIDTLHDAVKRFSDQASPIAGDMRQQVREHIESLQKRFGNGRKLTDDQLDRLTETQYQRFIDSSANNLYNILKNADDQNLPTKFAQVLEEQAPTVRQFKVAGEPIKPKHAPRWIDKGKNLVIKNDKVFEVDPKFWTVDLANSIRKMDLDKTAEEVAERKIREAGINVDEATGKELERVAQIKRETEETIGMPIRVKGDDEIDEVYRRLDNLEEQRDQLNKDLQRRRDEIDEQNLNPREDEELDEIFNKRQEIQKKINDAEQEAKEIIDKGGLNNEGSGKIGYVTDYSDEGFTVRTADGEVTKPFDKGDGIEGIGRPLTQDEINDNFVKGLAKDFVRKRQPVSELVQRRETATGVTQPQLPAYNFTRAESQYFKQINDIDNRLQNLRQRNLDETVEGQQSVRVKDRIETLKNERQRVIDELSQFYRDNPQVQKSRVQEKVKGDIGNKIDKVYEVKDRDTAIRDIFNDRNVEITNLDDGFVSYKIKKGENLQSQILVQDSPNAVRMERISIGRQRQGLGEKSYKALINDALAQGKQFHGDTSVTENAYKLVKKLEDDGYKVNYNQNIERVDNPSGIGGDFRYQSLDGEPIYKIYGNDSLPKGYAGKLRNRVENFAKEMDRLTKIQDDIPFC